MTFQVYFKHMASSPALLAHAREKLGERIDKYHIGIAETHVTFAVESGMNRATCHVVGTDGVKLMIETADAVSMYAAVDTLVDRLDEALRRAKDKRRSHRVAGPIDLRPPASTRLPPMDEESIDASEIVAATRAWARP